MKVPMKKMALIDEETQDEISQSDSSSKGVKGQLKDTSYQAGFADAESQKGQEKMTAELEQADVVASQHLERLNYPTQSSDLFQGPVGQIQEADTVTLLQTTAITTTAKRQTSLDGTPGLDAVSQLTVRGQKGCLSFHPNISDDQQDIQSKENITLSDQPNSVDWSLGVIQNDLSLTESFEPFEEESPIFESASKKAELPVDDDKKLELTLADIHEQQVMSGTWVDPDFPQYCTLSAREASFPAIAMLDGVRGNKTDFAMNGFFYRNTKGMFQDLHLLPVSTAGVLLGSGSWGCYPGQNTSSYHHDAVPSSSE
ncbi:uncharacterized protein LOC124110449 isoform X1 [Haliotis rufescens]|uniref:uncharacterized protein LOC124110449 isoform X1 n=1 Tax=Haliotis rufescens TaxID=6454 RepID=UPI00201EAF26|nr:uncharacterized protein LOC124110449 isoform X1 [Haliotis rufescens]